VPRKELRRSRDVVRLSSGQVDERALAFEAPWFGSACDAEGRASDSGPGEEEDDDDAQASAGDEEDEGGGNASDGDVAEDIEHVNTDGNEGEDEDEEEAPDTARTSSASQKRKLPSPPPPSHVDPARPNKKKVTFAKTLPPQPSAADKKRKSTLDLAASSKMNLAKGAKTGLRSSSTPARASRAAAQGGTARRTGTAKPAANAPTAAAMAGASEEGTYDFSKFF